MGKSKAWQQLERDTADHFGLKRNIKRGMDWGILDTDVDVIDDPNWGLDLIIDCKYRSNSEGALCSLMKDVAERCPPGLIPIIRFATDKYWYQVIKLEDLSDDELGTRDISKGTIQINDSINRYFVHTEISRAGTKYVDEWFDKLLTAYRPLKAAEYKKHETDLFPVVTVRKKGVRQTIAIVRYGERA